MLRRDQVKLVPKPASSTSRKRPIDLDSDVDDVQLVSGRRPRVALASSSSTSAPVKGHGQAREVITLDDDSDADDEALPLDWLTPVLPPSSELEPRPAKRPRLDPTAQLIELFPGLDPAEARRLLGEKTLEAAVGHLFDLEGKVRARGR